MIDADTGDFIFGDNAWPAICAEAGLDPHSWRARHQLENEITMWLLEPTSEQVKSSVDGTNRVVKAARTLLSEIEKTGADQFVDNDCENLLSAALEYVIYSWDWGREIESHGSRGPLPYVLCWTWKHLWGRELTCSVDPISGIPGGPLVRFLIAVCAQVVDEPLSPHGARYAIRAAKAVGSEGPVEIDEYGSIVESVLRARKVL